MACERGVYMLHVQNLYKPHPLLLAMPTSTCGSCMSSRHSTLKGVVCDVVRLMLEILPISKL